jgi:hypothetical protein
MAVFAATALNVVIPTVHLENDFKSGFKEKHGSIARQAVPASFVKLPISTQSSFFKSLPYISSP